MAKGYTVEQVAEIAEELRGSSDTLEGVLEGRGRYDLLDDPRFLEDLDEKVFCCVRCNWWDEQPANEIGGEWVCADCTEDDEKEDD